MSAASAGGTGTASSARTTRGRAFERVCAREGLELVDVLEELDRSGGDSARPLWNAALERVERGEVQALVVWNFSRFSRSAADAELALRRIEREMRRWVSRVRREHALKRRSFSAS